MPVTVHLAAPDVDEATLDRFTRELCRELNSETDMDASLPAGPARSGAKGEPITLGTIALAVVTSGALAKLFGVLKTYFERQSSLSITLKRESGEQLVLRAENLGGERFDETLQVARKFLGDPK